MKQSFDWYKSLTTVGKVVMVALAVIVVCSLGCGGGGSSATATPETRQDTERTIPYPPGVELGGAAGYAGVTDHADSRYFAVDNDWYEQASTETLTIIPRFATYQQTTEYTCGPASILMLQYHFGEHNVTEAQIGEAVAVNDTVGTTVEAVRDYFTALGWQVESHVSTSERFGDVNEFAEFVRGELAAGHPLLVDWTRWAGHWSVIIGIDSLGTAEVTDDVLITADPYDTSDHQQDGYYVVGIETFFSEWYEGLCAHKADPYRQPLIVAYP